MDGNGERGDMEWSREMGGGGCPKLDPLATENMKLDEEDQKRIWDGQGM